MPAKRKNLAKSPDKNESAEQEQPAPSPDIQTDLNATPIERPRRTAKRSNILASGDYEVNFPGVKQEEPDDEYLTPVKSPPPAKVPGTAKRGRPPNRPSEQPAKRKARARRDSVKEEFSPDGVGTSAGDYQIAPVLTDDFEEEVEEESSSSDEDLEENENPPELEASGTISVKRSRGRPKKPDHERKSRGSSNSRLFRNSPRINRPGDRAVSKTIAERYNSFSVKLFSDQIGITELGDCYATVIPGCLAYLLRKERIIDLLTNVNEIETIRESGWMLDRSPRLPPLVTHKTCFAFYVDGSKMHTVKDISGDDLKPWSTSDPIEGEPVIKPNVRRHAVSRVNNRLVPMKGDPRLAELHLTEYSAWLPRLHRLRKKIFYLARDGQIFGNVLILYDYTCPGEVPVVLSLPHGNDMLRAISQDDVDIRLPSVGDADNPFDEDLINGPKGEKFLRVRPSKLGWINNKKLVLKYLINEPQLLDNSGYLNRRTPYLPPLIETSGVFAYFAPASFIANQVHHSADGLSPWTVNTGVGESGPRVRSVRRALVQEEDGTFSVTKEDWQNTGLALVETLTVLARCPRLRKRVLYVQRSGAIAMGHVCYIYEYIRDGPIPIIIRTTKQNQKWDRRKSTSGTNASGLAEDDDFIDVEDVEVMDEDDVMDATADVDNPNEQEPDYDEITEDTLNAGWDNEFEEDPISSQENPDPYYEGARMLDTGHVYLTVRHKRLVSSLDCVLEYICNSNIVEERGLVNYSKPAHPPIVRNARSYAFFVSGTAIFPHDINRDDFSPWSHNGTPDNPTCYRTKVRKIGVICDERGSQFQVKDVDYKTCPFHLVYLYSINPRDPRLRKKIYYLMETESRLVVSHALIIYDYNTEGTLPRFHGPYVKRFSKKPRRTAMLPIHDVENDVSDVSEHEKESPFLLPPQEADDGTCYLTLLDIDFLNDRNRQLHYLVNKPTLIDAIGCLNNRVPALPPATTGKGAYLFFIDCLEVDPRNLTCDGLAPWSESASVNSGAFARRPKSHKLPLGLNREGHLRVIRSTRNDNHEFQLHVYSATLPRCPRLRKRVVYVLKNGAQIGNAMVAYWFTEPGEMPTPVTHGNAMHLDAPFTRLPPSLRDEARRLLLAMPPNDVARILSEKSDVPITVRSLYNVRRELRRDLGIIPDHRYQEVKPEIMDTSTFEDVWGQSDETQILNAMRAKDVHAIVDDASMQVAHTEEIHGGQDVHYRTSLGAQLTNMGAMTQMNGTNRTASYTSSTTYSAKVPPLMPGTVRGTQRTDALWRIAKSTFGAQSDTETFDSIWKLLLDKNEPRLLHNVHQTFGIEIVAGVMEGEPIEVEGDNGQVIHLAPGQVIEEHVVEEEMVLAQPTSEVPNPQKSTPVQVGIEIEVELASPTAESMTITKENK